MLLSNPEVIKWCFEGVTNITMKDTSDEKKLKIYKEQEKKWGNKVMGTKDAKQWTTKLCQNIVQEALTASGKNNVRKIGQVKSSLRDKKYDPDLVCDEFVYEVKGRSWCTPGTAGEKILGVPLKYGEVPSLYKKPLKIVLVAYQEYEAREAWGFGDLLDSKEQTKELKDALNYHKDHNIEYIGLTDILKTLGLGKEYWYD